MIADLYSVTIFYLKLALLVHCTGLVIFWSDTRCPHEVLKTVTTSSVKEMALQSRVALTIWYNDGNQLQEERRQSAPVGGSTNDSICAFAEKMRSSATMRNNAADDELGDPETPKYTAHVVNGVNKLVEVIVQLPRVRRLSENIVLDVGPTRLRLLVNADSGRPYSLHVDWCSIAEVIVCTEDTEAVFAKFSKKQRQLTVRVPIKICGVK